MHMLLYKYNPSHNITLHFEPVGQELSIIYDTLATFYGH